MNQQGFEFGLSNLGGILLAIAGGLLLIFLFTSTAESAEGKIRGHGFTNFICQFKIFQTFVSACKPYLEIQERTHDLGQSLQQCFKDQKADCPDAVQALYHVLIQQGKTLRIQNSEPTGTSDVIIIDEEGRETPTPFNFLLAACHAEDPSKLRFHTHIYIKKGEQKTMELSYTQGTGDLNPSPYKPISGIGSQPSDYWKKPTLCIYYHETS